jgi:hypothetical protein
MIGWYGTLGESQGTVRWTDGPVSSYTGWIAEMKQRIWRCRMNRWSIGAHCRSIRWFTGARQRGYGARLVAPDESTDQASVHLMAMKFKTVRFWPQSLQHRMNRRTIGWSVRWIVSADLQWLHDIEEHQMNRRLWKREHRFIRRYKFLQLLANGSLDALGYLYPLHSPIWGGWMVWKCRGVQDT